MARKQKKKNSNKNTTLKLKEISKNKKVKKVESKKIKEETPKKKIEDKKSNNQDNKKVEKNISKQKIEDKNANNQNIKTTKQKISKLLKNKKVIITVSIISILLITLTILFILPVKRNVYIELGTKKITDKIFTRNIPSSCKILTDISKLDLTKVKNHQIKIKLNGLIINSTLHIVDTTAPKVKFQDVYQYKDYQIKASDFIKSKQDLSKMKVYIENKVTIK